MQPQPKHIIIIIIAAIFALGCGPGKLGGDQPSAMEHAAEACHALCEVRSTCDPTATNPDAAGCFDTCMGLVAITDESACGAAQREFQACIGALDCEGYVRTMTPNIDEDPCAEAKLRFADLKCGVEASP